MKKLAVLALLLSLLGCATSPKPATPQFEPPASCLEPAQEIPAPLADLYLYAADLIVLLTQSGVQREQCRAALNDLATPDTATGTGIQSR